MQHNGILGVREAFPVSSGLRSQSWLFVAVWSSILILLQKISLKQACELLSMALWAQRTTTHLNSWQHKQIRETASPVWQHMQYTTKYRNTETAGTWKHISAMFNIFLVSPANIFNCHLHYLQHFCICRGCFLNFLVFCLFVCVFTVMALF